MGSDWGRKPLVCVSWTLKMRQLAEVEACP